MSKRNKKKRGKTGLRFLLGEESIRELIAAWITSRTRWVFILHVDREEDLYSWANYALRIGAVEPKDEYAFAAGMLPGVGIVAMVSALKSQTASGEFRRMVESVVGLAVDERLGAGQDLVLASYNPDQEAVVKRIQALAWGQSEPLSAEQEEAGRRLLERIQGS